MKTVLFVLFHALRSCFQARLALQAENLALRHQITVLQRGRARVPLNAADRFFWVCLSRLWVVSGLGFLYQLQSEFSAP